MLYLVLALIMALAIRRKAQMIIVSNVIVGRVSIDHIEVSNEIGMVI
jgi:hypothetical protein